MTESRGRLNFIQFAYIVIRSHATCEPLEKVAAQRETTSDTGNKFDFDLTEG